MDYNLEIHIYELTNDFNIPVAFSPANHIEMKAGDIIITIGNLVYIENKPNPDNDPMNFTEALFKKNFLDANSKLFKLKL